MYRTARCPECGGSGRLGDGYNEPCGTCNYCHGTGYVLEEEEKIMEGIREITYKTCLRCANRQICKLYAQLETVLNKTAQIVMEMGNDPDVGGLVRQGVAILNQAGSRSLAKECDFYWPEEKHEPQDNPTR